MRQTGAPWRTRAYHNTQTGGIKHGSGGTFFAPDPTSEYGDVLIPVMLSFRRALVVGDRIDAAQALMPGETAEEIERTVVDDLPLSSDPRSIYHRIDTDIARAARKRGYDGIVYTRPYSLSREEYVALTRRGWRLIGKPKTRDR